MKAIPQKKERFLFLLILSILLVSGCEPAPFPGYSEVEEGVYYQRIYLGDGEREPKAGDRLWVDVKYKSLQDSLLFSSNSRTEGRKGMFLLSGTPENAFKKALFLLREGDSALFIIDSEKLQGHQHMIPIWKKFRYVKLEVKVKKLMGKEEYQEKRRSGAERRSARLEKRKVDQYFEKIGKSPEKYFYKGIYFLPVQKGTGPEVSYGDRVLVHYKGYFLDSTLFDNTYLNDTPLDFQFGDPGQVIQGFEIGLSRMKKGGVAKFLLPSDKAFGRFGSSTGIVPPFTTVLYEVELKNVEPSTD